MVSYKLSTDYCKNVIKVFSEKETMETLLTHNRLYKRFIIIENSELKDKYEWFWNDIDNLIKNNLGNNHYLSIWIIILKYEKGDYFKKHQDRVTQDDDRYLSGGIELSDKNDFEGANYVVKNKVMEFERGKLFTHGVTEMHEITECKNGTRWSLHFGINKQADLI